MDIRTFKFPVGSVIEHKKKITIRDKGYYVVLGIQQFHTDDWYYILLLQMDDGRDMVKPWRVDIAEDYAELIK